MKISPGSWGGKGGPRTEGDGGGTWMLSVRYLDCALGFSALSQTLKLSWFLWLFWFMLSSLFLFIDYSLWFVLNRIKGQMVSLAHRLYRGRDKKLPYWALPCVAFPPSLIATQAQKWKLRLWFSVVRTRHGDGEPQHTDKEALLKLLCNKQY